MGLKSELNLSREGFNKMLAVIGTLLPEGHILPGLLGLPGMVYGPQGQGNV